MERRWRPTQWRHGEARPPRSVPATPQSRQRRPVMMRPARRHFAALAALLMIWALVARRQTRLARGLAGGDGGRAGLEKLRAATTQSYTVTDATASGSGLTVKYLLDFEAGERALFKPLRSNFERIGGKEVKDARHLEEPWGEVMASALARVLRLRNVPPAIIMDVPAERLAAATAPRSLRALLSRCPRYISRKLVRRLAPSISRDGCALRDDVDMVKGALVRWEPEGLVNVARSNRWFLRGARALCGVGACPMTLKERRAWGDLEVFDAILGNYDRKNNIFLRRSRIAPLDHNHVGRNLTVARVGWRWCDASPAVANIVRAAAAKEVVHEGCATDGSLFAAVACEAAPDTLPEKFRFLDANAIAYAVHLDSPFCRRRRES